MASKLEKYELFYSNSSVYSNFYPAVFTDPELMRRIPDTSDISREGDLTFVHVEQYMHACKVKVITMYCNVQCISVKFYQRRHFQALLFKDHEVLEKILLTSDPMETKRLGRKVANFIDDDWVAVARDIVTRGCWLKFR